MNLNISGKLINVFGFLDYWAWRASWDCHLLDFQADLFPGFGKLFLLLIIIVTKDSSVADSKIEIYFTGLQQCEREFSGWKESNGTD